MVLYSFDERYKLYHGNMLNMLEDIKPNSIDSIVTDPPYELNFMNKGWDNSGIAFSKDAWEQCYKVLKPGGYLLAFGGSRTFHRIAVAIEDAGFEIRDTIMWIYGSGFPKSMDIAKSIEAKLITGSANKTEFKNLNGEKAERGTLGFATNNFIQGARPNDYNKIDADRLSKLVPTTEGSIQWQGWGTTLKPSYEPIIVARKPCEGSTTDNTLKWGVGGINIDECRIPTDDYLYNHGNSNGTVNSVSIGNYGKSIKGENRSTDLGRFPANTILTYDDTDEDEVCGGFPTTSGGDRHNVALRVSDKNSGYGFDINTRNEFSDSGSASRYFYCAKASKKDRDEGLSDFADVTSGCMEANVGDVMQLGGASLSDNPKPIQPRKNLHPTVKPTELMQYLIRLVTPNAGTVLDPFNGSGSTGKAVMFENLERDKQYKYIGIELTEQYLPISKARIEYVFNGYVADKESEMLKETNKDGLHQRKLF